MARRSWMLPARRTSEATPQQRVATGASSAGGGYDELDGDYGYRQVGAVGPREIPQRTRERARVDSIASYRSNPMARAIIDTYVAFSVGDVGLTLNCSSDLVRPFADRFWTDPRNQLVAGQELMLTSALLNGEAVNEMMVGPITGAARRSPIDPTRIKDVLLRDGNPLWPDELVLRGAALEDDTRLKVASVDDQTGLWAGEVLFWPMFKSLETDRRGAPFLMPVLDWLDSYDAVLFNLIDRTALARFIAMDVTLKGENADVDAFVKSRGGTQMPRSGTIEVHNDSVEWKPLAATTGSFEDTNTNKAILTTVAAGSGLSKVWLAEPEDANRATSLTMAEPVRRRIGSVQNQWINNLSDLARYQIDQIVAAGRLPRTVMVVGTGGVEVEMPTSSTVSITGPQIAAADATVTAQTLFNLSQGLDTLAQIGALSPEARKLAGQKAWSDYMGIPWRSELDSVDADQGDVATHVDDTNPAGGLMNKLAVV